MTTATYPMRHRRGDDDAERLARGLGWFSVGLGVAEIAAPRAVARMIGVDDGRRNRKKMVAIGIREVTSGVGILTRPRPGRWVWARVGGDVMDLALLGAALRSGHAQRGRVAGAAAAVAGVTLLDVLASGRLRHQTDGVAARRLAGHAVRVTRAITVNRPPEEVYGFWHDFRNFPRFMEHLESVEVIDERRSHWRAKGPAGKAVEWDAEIAEDRPNELIAWRSLGGADVPNSGSVRFHRAPDGRGTEVLVELEYRPPGGKLGAAIAKLFGEEPGQQVARDLHRFKQVLELGEVVQSDASLYRGPHPAQPPEEAPTQATERPAGKRIPVRKGAAR